MTLLSSMAILLASIENNEITSSKYKTKVTKRLTSKPQNRGKSTNKGEEDFNNNT